MVVELQLHAELQRDRLGEPFVRWAQRAANGTARAPRPRRPRGCESSTIGWNDHARRPRRPRTARSRRGEPDLARCSISSRRSCEASSCTIPPITSVGQARAAVATPSRSSRAISSAGGALDQVADRAGAEHLEHRGPVLERRERDHPGVGRDPDDLARRSRPAARRHLHVDQRDVRAARSRRARSPRRRRPRCPPAPDRVLVREEVGEGDAQGRLVVGDQDADRSASRAPPAVGGSSDGGHGADRTRRRGALKHPAEPGPSPDPAERIRPPGVLSMRRTRRRR